MALPIRQQLTQASAAIASGGICAYPTEHCFGLGCNPKDSQAVQKILKLKRRSASKGLIIIGCNFSQLQPYVKELRDEQLDKMLDSWPAAITWLVPAAKWVPQWLRGDSDKIAIRVPDHKIASQLCLYCDHALISTSANRSGQTVRTTSEQVKKHFDEGLDYIVDASCGGYSDPSTIIDIDTGIVIRAVSA